MQTRATVRLLSLVVAMACGTTDSTTSTTTPPSAVFYKVDSQTCTGSAAIDFFIDGSIVGTETLSAGGTSKGYATTQASHVLGAQISNTHARVWGPQTVNLAGIAAYTYILPCA